MCGSDARTVLVIGAGPNGLVAANLLVDAGWDVQLLEAQDHVGGAVASDEERGRGLRARHVQQLLSPGAASPVIAALELEQHGLRWRHAPAVLGHPFPDGELGAAAPRRRSIRQPTSTVIIPATGTPGGSCTPSGRSSGLPGGRPAVPVSPGTGGTRRAGPAAPGRGTGLRPDLHRARAEPGRDAVRLRRPRGCCWPATPCTPTSRCPRPARGCSGCCWRCWVTRWASRYPRVVPADWPRRWRTGSPAAAAPSTLGTRAERILTDRRRVTGVITSTGEHHGSVRWLPTSPPPRCTAGWCPGTSCRLGWRPGWRRFQLDPATIKVDWALSAPVPWASRPAVAPGTVHIADSLEELRDQPGEGPRPRGAGSALPAGRADDHGRPDTRSPAGTEALWAYTHVPQDVRDDERGEVTGTWDDRRSSGWPTGCRTGWNVSPPASAPG